MLDAQVPLHEDVDASAVDPTVGISQQRSLTFLHPFWGIDAVLINECINLAVGK
jgi:hypothetical protein